MNIDIDKLLYLRAKHGELRERYLTRPKKHAWRARKHRICRPNSVSTPQ